MNFAGKLPYVAQILGRGRVRAHGGTNEEERKSQVNHPNPGIRPSYSQFVIMHSVSDYSGVTHLQLAHCA